MVEINVSNYICFNISSLLKSLKLKVLVLTLGPEVLVLGVKETILVLLDNNTRIKKLIVKKYIFITVPNIPDVMK